MIWSDREIELLKKLHAELWTCSRIATRLNGKSRNAVIGKIHRLGLVSNAGPQSCKQQRKGRPRKLRLVAPPVEAPKPKKRASDLFKFECLPLPVEDTPPAKLMAVADLEAHHCRWVYGNVGEPVHGFCGKEKVEGLSYCLDHARKAYAPSRPTTDVHYVIKVRTREFA